MNSTNRFARAPKALQFLLMAVVIAVTLCVVELLSFAILKRSDQKQHGLAPWHSMVTHFHPLFQPARPSEYVFDPYLGFRNRPDAAVYNVLATDHNGFIKNDPSAHDVVPRKAPGTVRIFLVGGSSVAGSGLASNRETIASTLEAYLNAHEKQAGRRFEVINAATSSYTSAQELVLTDIYLMRFQPDIIISIDGWNDFFLTCSQALDRTQPNWIPYHYELASAFDRIQSARSLLSMAITKSKDSFYTAQLIHSKSPAAARGVEVEADGRRWTREYALSGSGFDDYSTNLRSLAGSLERNGVKGLLILQPNVLTRTNATEEERRFVDSVGFSGSYSAIATQWFRMGRTLFAKLQESTTADVAFLDLTRAFDEEKGTLFLDHVHYNKDGAGVLARVIGDEILGREKEGGWAWATPTSLVATYTGEPQQLIGQPVGDRAVLEGYDIDRQTPSSIDLVLHWKTAPNSQLPRDYRWVERRTLANLLKNGSFEDRLENGFPSGWPGAIYSGSEFRLRPGSGGQVLSLESTAAHARSGIYSNAVHVTPGKTYLFMGRMFSRHCNLSAGVIWQGGPRVTDDNRYRWCVSGYDVPQWQAFAQLVQPIPDTTQCQIWLTNVDTKGSGDFDDLMLIEMEPPKMPRTPGYITSARTSSSR